MKQLLITLHLALWSFNSQAQTYISDSLMSIYVESGLANKKFIPKGKLKEGVRVGKWEDYTFEFIHTYWQNEDIIDVRFDHLLIKSTGNYVNGEKSGLWKFYAVEEGTFKKTQIAEVTYKNGKRQGQITFYYSSGETAATGNNENELLQGVLTVFYKTGELARKANVEQGQVQGVMTHYYRTGEKKGEVNFNNGMQNGASKFYYTNGAIKTNYNYVNDTLQGACFNYYPNNNVQQEAIYENDTITTLKYFYESGQLWVYKEYKNGTYYNVLALFDVTGKPLDYGTLKDGTGTVKYYTENAKVYLIETYKDGTIINEERFD